MIKVREQRNVGLIEGGDFLDVLLSKKSLTNDEIVSIVLDILLGGYETTATLIALIVYFLGHAPNALEKLKVAPILCLSLSLSLINCMHKLI